MVAKGTLIHEEKPFVHVLSSKFRLFRCDNCYSQSELLKCSGCQYVRYCDRGCQKEGWTDHKAECGFLRKLPPGRELPNAARLIAKIIMKLKRGGGREKGFYAKTKHRMFKDLMSHYSDIKEDPKRMEHTMVLYEVLREYMGAHNLPNTAEFMGIYGRVVVNTFNILDCELGSLGSGVYLGASTIDHSCQPNAVATFSSTLLYIRTIQEIPNYDWSKVRISYIDVLDKSSRRREELLHQYYFLCDCPRCMDPSEDLLMDSMMCPHCAQPVPVTLEEAEMVTCSSCGKTVEEEVYRRFIEVTRYTHQQHDIMADVAYLDVCKKCLERQEGLLHPLNLLHLKTLDMGLESSFQLGRWDVADALAQKLTQGYRRYYGENHPLLGLHYMRLGKLHLLKGRQREALSALEKAEEIVRTSHGKSSTLYTSQLKPLLLDAKSLLY